LGYTNFARFGLCSSGLKKILCLRFTVIDIENPSVFSSKLCIAGDFIGIFWDLCNWLPRRCLSSKDCDTGSAALSAFNHQYLPYRCSMHFIGTPVVTGFMLVGNLYLLLWDYQKIRLAARAIFAES
jgi:hypothetical protein